MSISTILTQGYGSFGNANFLPTLGYGAYDVATTVTPSGGGGGVPNRHPLPQYYSRRVFDERVSLPQDATSNRVAIEVLDDAKELEKRLAHDDRHFTDMLEQTQHMLKQTATYIESQQIYNIVVSVQNRIQARRDAEIAVEMKSKADDAEFDELMEIL